MNIPTNEQIDGLLTGKTWVLVEKYCEGRWADLAKGWTVSFANIRDEAERRGLECFVAPKPVAEGYWLCAAGQAFEVFYFERGIRMYRQSFSSLSKAFDAWLEQELASMQLPQNQVSM